MLQRTPTSSSNRRLLLVPVALLLCFQLLLMHNEAGAQPQTDDHGNTFADATALLLDGSTTGDLETSTDLDVFTFAVTGSPQDVWLYTTGDTDTVGLLFKNDGDLRDPATAIGVSDDGIIVAGFNFHIGMTLEPGTYYVAVVGAQGTDGTPDTGTYSIHGLNLSALGAFRLGTTQSGEIETEGEVGVFKFSFTGDDRDVWLYSTGSTDTIGLLYHSDNISAASPSWVTAGDDSTLATSGNFFIGANLEPGTYYVAVIGAPDETGNMATGPYNLESGAGSDEVAEVPFESGDPTPSNVIPNSTSIGIIAPGGDVDLFEVVLSSEMDIVVYSTGEVDTIGTILDADGDTVDGNDDTEFSEGDFNFFLPITLEPGVYYIEVTGYVGRSGESTGPYKLHVDSVADQSNRRGGAERVSLGSFSMGFLSGAEDQDYFSFDVPSPGHVRVYTIGPTDTVGRLEDRSGRVLQANDDGFLSTGHAAFLIESHLLPGNYHVSVSGWEEETGPYRLVVEPVTDPGGSAGGAEDLELGAPAIGYVEAGDVDLFRLVLDEPKELVLYTSGATDTTGALLRGDGTTEVESDDDGGEGFNFLIQATLGPGTQYIRVEGYSNAVSGSYSLFAEEILPVRTFGTLPGEHAVGGITAGHDQDFYKINISGETPTWIYTTGLVDTVGTLYDSNFNEIAHNDDIGLVGLSSSFSIRETLVTGTYYVNVASHGTATGGYALHVLPVVEPGNNLGTATTLELGVPAPGTIESENDAGYFRFDFGDDTHNYGSDTYFLLDVIAPGESVLEGEVLDNHGQHIDVNIYPYPGGFILAENFPSGTYYVKVTGSDPPVPYSVIILPHGRYANLAGDCSEATAGLTALAANGERLDDPYYACQWHLKNREPLQAGEDVNIEDAWATMVDGKPVRGDGVNVVVVDDGMDWQHEDLSPNVEPSRNHDYSGEGDIHKPSEHHGTIVSGVLAARDNSVGVRGVAPRATIHGHNFLAAQSSFSEADSMTRNREVTAVSNNSWGPVDTLGFAESFWESAVEKGTQEGYGGKGTFYVFAAGNGALEGDDANLDEFANFYAVTSACGVNDRGTRSDFSVKGSSLWVCAPGGDSRDGYRGLVSTDNSDRYRDRSHGTSYSAPIVSGVAALLRQVNPDLTWRDLKLILAASARKNDPQNPGWEDGARKYGSGSAADVHHFNYEYGFGVVDAKAAVDLGKRWEIVPILESQTVRSLEGLSVRIPPVGTATHTLRVETDVSFVEFVEVKAHFQHSSFRDLEIELVSPGGETSKLVTHHQSEEAIPLTGEIRLGSSKHLGEAPYGTWTIRVTDRINNDKSGNLEWWEITVYGHRPTPGVPRAVSVTPGAERLTVTWEEPEVTRGEIASYDLRYTRASGGEPVLVENLPFSGAAPFSYDITSLPGAVEYLVQVRANNATGKGPWSEPVEATSSTSTSTCATGQVLQGLAGQPVYQNLVDDCDALLEIGRALSEPGSLNWSTGVDFGNWDGVTADYQPAGTTFRVTKLELEGRGLTGTIPTEVGQLTGLDTLDLSDNGLTGNVPQELGNLTALAELDLSKNRLSGHIPAELGTLRVLETLDLSGNQLSGVIPQVLGELDASTPAQPNLARLKTLRLNANALSGTIPANLGNLSSLQELDLSHNQLSGTIPTDLSRLGGLQQLLLPGNQLSGGIPVAVMTMPNLERLDLGDNLLTVETDGLPVPTSQNHALEVLDLSQNQLSGQLPNGLSNWAQLTELRLDNNLFSGDIPVALDWGTFSRLTLVDLSTNQLTGPVPPNMRSLASLRKLYLNGNGFVDDVTSWGGALNDLDELFIAQTGKTLTGCIPGALRNVGTNDLPDLGLPYCDLFLAGLSLLGAELKAPLAFDLPVFNYEAVAGPSVVTIIPVPQSGDILSLEYRDGQNNVIGVTDAANPEHEVDLGIGITTVKVAVVPQDKRAEHVYQIRFERAGTPDAPVVDPAVGVVVGDRSLDVAWSAPANDGGYRIISYDLRYIETNATFREDRHWTLLEEVWESDRGGPLEATVNQLVSGLAYEVQVRAFNGAQHSSWSLPVQGTPHPVSCGSGAISDLINNRELAADCGALLAVRDTLAGSGSVNWSESEPITNWDGTTTGGTPERITGLDLAGKGLDGQIPPSLGRLTGLTTLDLSDNNLTGELPRQLAHMTELTTLNLGDDPDTEGRNRLTGEVPSWVGDLSNLVTLNLSGNEFGGTLPAQVGNLNHLAHLNLSDNQLRGMIPSSFSRSVNWLDIDLSGNQLEGTIPPLTVVNSLDLADNQLTGSIPALGGSLGPSGLLDLSNNQLSGSIPDTWGVQSTGTPPTTKLGGVTRLRLAGNQLTGRIPPALGNLTNLTELDLGDNGISGGVPSLAGLSALEKLYLNDNDLTGVIPAWLPTLTGLREVDIGGNDLVGEVPSGLGALGSLTHLDLSDNRLTGGITGKLAGNTNLEVVLLGGNNFTGEIPAQFGTLQSLKQLDLSENRLSGEIPATLGNATGLEQLRMNANQLEGAIPAQLGSLIDLVVLDLGENGLTGAIPNRLGRLAALEVLDLQQNSLTGGIPAELGSLDNLRELVLQENHLNGSIPTTLGRLSDLEELLLGDNELTGNIPPQLGDLANLEVLDLYHNNLTGPIPEELNKLVELRMLVLAQLDLDGEPPDLGTLVNLEELYFWGNRLEGPAPEWIRKLANLQSLLLRDNNFGGPVPAWLAELPHLEALYLADNNWTGCMPAELEALVDEISNDLRVLGLPSCPNTPSVNVVSPGPGSLMVLWDLPDDPNNLIDRFEVRHIRSDTPEAAKADHRNWTVDQVSPPGTESGDPIIHTITALTTGVQYDVQVRWVTVDNDDGSWSATRVGTPGGDPLFARYDTNRNGVIDRSEVIAAINDYLDGEGITRADLMLLINLYLDG